MNIRPFHSSDYDTVMEIWAVTGLTPKDVDSLEAIEKFIGKYPDLFLVVETDGQIIGTVIGTWDGRRGWIYHLAVRPEQQVRGLGRQLMLQIEENLRRYGASQINVLVEENNSKVIGFYEKIGYDATPRTLLKKKV